MYTIKAYSAKDQNSPVRPVSIQRRDPGPQDVKIEILYCGVCHSDLHQVRNEWQNTIYPCVPGHEIVGRVTGVGSEVKRFKPGDLAAVGCLVDSCGVCTNCKEDLEQFCERIPIFTYNGEDKHLGGPTFGGYSESIVVKEGFVFLLPGNLDPAAAAPLLCAGITTYSPMRYQKVREGKKIGVVGLGGLGHMALKFGKAFGAYTVLFTTSESKKAEALRLGANEVVISRDLTEMQKHLSSFDFILNTVSAPHDINAYIELLKRDGTLTMVGAPPEPLAVSAFSVIMNRRRFMGSLIGGIRETQEMLDFCAEHEITSDIEMIPIQQINEAYERMLKSDVKYRFVIDMSSL